MRMPEMDGIQLLCKIKVKFPEAIRFMLTGNTDQPTAVKAVNEGNVYRFLTKPCDEDVLKRELNSALVQYRLAALHEQSLAREGNLPNYRPVTQQQARSDGSGPEISQYLRELLPKDTTIRHPSIGGAIYIGKIIGEDSDHVVQSICATVAIAHPRNLLSRAPAVGEYVSIEYSAGTATVISHRRATAG